MTIEGKSPNENELERKVPEWKWLRKEGPRIEMTKEGKSQNEN